MDDVERLWLCSSLPNEADRWCVFDSSVIQPRARIDGVFTAAELITLVQGERISGCVVIYAFLFLTGGFTGPFTGQHRSKWSFMLQRKASSLDGVHVCMNGLGPLLSHQPKSNTIAPSSYRVGLTKLIQLVSYVTAIIELVAHRKQRKHHTKLVIEVDAFSSQLWAVLLSARQCALPALSHCRSQRIGR